MKALVYGDLAIDISVRGFAELREGENLILKASRWCPGGVAANTALNLSVLSISAWVAGAVGRDPLGDYLLERLQANNVQTEAVKRADTVTAITIIMVSKDGERTMIAMRNANETYVPDPTALDKVNPDWVHISGYTLLNRKAIDKAEQIINKAIHRGVGVSVELEGLHGAKNLFKEGVYVLGSRKDFRYDDINPKVTFILKNGKNGCDLLKRGTTQSIPGYEVNVLDSTGAGDAFNAGFIMSKLKDKDDEDACMFGNACGALKVQKRGSSGHFSEAAVLSFIDGHKHASPPKNANRP